MKKKILITGGAGFIGSHLCDELIRNGYHVRVLDNLSPQVHGEVTSPPAYLNDQVEFIYGDVRDAAAVHNALQGIDAVYHFAAAVGVGQSMYEIENYTSNNNIGTTVLLEAIIRQPVEKFIIASSMGIYGEGFYQKHDGTLIAGGERTLEQLKQSDWEVYDSTGEILFPVATPESKDPVLASIYALSKFDQEQMCLIIGRTYSIPTVALRFFNVFGTRQSLSNPYTGVLAIFASRYLNDHPPLIFEDGYQKRDFVSVYDIVHACRLALETPEASGGIFNIGSGIAYTIREVAEKMAKALGKEEIGYTVTGRYRAGDIRHCYADISLARRVLRYEPQVFLEQGLIELSSWLETQIAHDRVEMAAAELSARGLTV